MGHHRASSHLAAIRHGAFATLCVFLLSTPGFAADLQISGVSDEDLLETIRGGSLLAEQTGEDADPSTQELLAAAQADYSRLLAVLYDEGYFAPVIRITIDGVDAADIPPVQPPAQIRQAVITVNPGPKFRFGTARISPLAPKTELPEEFASGETASLSVLKKTVSRGISGWRDQGHAKAELASQSLTAQVPQQKINAELKLNPGPRLRFGNLNISGESAVRRERILAIAGLPTGEVFSPEELEDAAKRLRRTGAFNAVALTEADQIQDPDILPIDLQVTDAKPRRYGVGGEYSTDEGITLRGFWLHRNLLGGGEKLRFDAGVSGIGGTSSNSGRGENYLVGVTFERPATFNPDTNFYALAKIEQKDEENYFSRALDIAAGFRRIVDDERSYSLGVGFTRATTRDAFGEADYTLFTLPAGAIFDYRDNELDAKKGYYANIGLLPFLAIAGTDNGLRSTVDLRGYKTFGTTRPITFALRGQLGSIFGPSLPETPANFLFYSGGSGTVRGQPYETLGVELPNGDTVGGRSFLGVSAEARIPVKGNIGVVAFADAGYIGAEQFPDGSGVWQSGAGLGVRYATGVGPIRVDLAVPVSGPETEDDFQLYIGIGQAF